MTTTPLSGQDLIEYNNLPCTPIDRPLGDLLNSIIASSTAPSVDTVEFDTGLDATGVLLSLDLEPGTYDILLQFSMNVIGGGGWLLAPENTDLVFTPFNYTFSGVETAGPVAPFAVPSGSASYAFSGATLGTYQMVGTMVVQTGGTIGMRFTLTDPPVTNILGGARLVATRQ